MDQFGITQDQRLHVLQILEKALGAFSSVKVYIFGSRATGTFKKYSDVDLLIESVPELSNAELDQIKNGLSESSIPYQFDVTTPDRLVEGYREGIHQTKKLFFEKG